MDGSRRNSASSSSTSSSASELERGMQEIGLGDRSSPEESNAATTNTRLAPPASAVGRTSHNSFAGNTEGSNRHSLSHTAASSVDAPPTRPTAPNACLATDNAQATESTSRSTSEPRSSAPSYLAHRLLPTQNSSSTCGAACVAQVPLSGPEEDRKPAAVDTSITSSGRSEMCLPGQPPPSSAAVAASLEPEETETNRTSQQEDSCEESKPVAAAVAAAAVAAAEERRPSKKKRSSKSSKKGGGGGDESHSTGRWTDAEHQAFLRGLALYGREWKKVASHIPTRTSAQVRSHAQKYFTKMQRDQDAFLILSSSSGGGAQSNAQVPSANDAQPSVGSAAAGGPNGNNAEGPGPGLIPGLTPSMQNTVSRILSNPESVEAEVEDTLQRLRERYAQLQQRLEQSEQASSRAALVPPEPLRLQGRKRPAEQEVAASTGSTATSVSSQQQQQQQLQDEELIALSVLQGALPRSGGSSANSSHADTASELGNNTSNCSHNSHNAEEEDDDDTTLTNASNSSNKRTKTCDSSSL